MPKESRSRMQKWPSSTLCPPNSTVTGTTHFYPVAIRSAHVICAQAPSSCCSLIFPVCLTPTGSFYFANTGSFHFAATAPLRALTPPHPDARLTALELRLEAATFKGNKAMPGAELETFGGNKVVMGLVVVLALGTSWFVYAAFTTPSTYNRFRIFAL